MKEGLNDRFLRGFTFVLVVIIVIGGLVLVWPNYQRSRTIMRRDAEIALRIEKKRAEIELLRANQKRFQVDREFVEAIARQNNRVFPGELVFIFDED